MNAACWNWDGSKCVLSKLVSLPEDCFLYLSKIVDTCSEAWHARDQQRCIYLLLLFICTLLSKDSLSPVSTIREECLVTFKLKEYIALRRSLYSGICTHYNCLADCIFDLDVVTDHATGELGPIVWSSF